MYTTLFGLLRGFHFFHILKLKSGGYFIAVGLKCLRLPLTPRTLLGINFFHFSIISRKRESLENGVRVKQGIPRFLASCLSTTIVALFNYHINNNSEVSSHLVHGNWRPPPPLPSPSSFSLKAASSFCKTSRLLRCSFARSFACSLAHSFAHLAAHLLRCLLIHSFSRLFARLPAHSLTRLLIYAFAHVLLICLLVRSFARLHTLLPAYSLIFLLDCSFAGSFAHLPACLLICSLICPLALF